MTARSAAELDPAVTHAHHDGSGRYADTDAPSLRDPVPVRVWTAAVVRRVWLRAVVDGEPVFAELAPDGRVTASGRWWVGEVVVHNPVARYRFFLESEGGAGRWLNQRGVVAHDPADDEDFRLVAHEPPPDWAGSACLYQILPDRFARSGQVRPDRDLAHWDAPVDATADQWYGGDLWGIADRLDHVVDLGVTGIYLTPVFPAPHSHRYNASTFEQVDPLLGGDTALIGLTSAAHARGLRIIGDLTANHSGDSHEWFAAARADPSAPERAYYLWERYPDDYACWGGFRTLPRFDHTDPGLRQRLLTGDDAVAARWLRPPVELDGWRVDAANVAGRAGATDFGHRVASDLRATMRREDGFLFAEHCHDATGDLDRGGWHATMDYSGFTRPVWSWLRGRRRPDLLGLPVPVLQQDGVAARQTMDTFRARVSWQAHRHRVHLLGSHDTSRWRSTAGDRDRTVMGFGLLATMPGIPSVFAGDEIGMTGMDRGEARAPFPWGHPERWDRSLLHAVRRLLTLRGHVPALTHGGFRWVSTGSDHMTFLREHGTGDVLVHVARAVHRPPDVSAFGPSELLYGEAAPTGSLSAMLSTDAGVTIRRLEPQV